MMTDAIDAAIAVVPGYYLVCYNLWDFTKHTRTAVVPGSYLVCYNLCHLQEAPGNAVVPGYYLVCYNPKCSEKTGQGL